MIEKIWKFNATHSKSYELHRITMCLRLFWSIKTVRLQVKIPNLGGWSTYFGGTNPINTEPQFKRFTPPFLQISLFQCLRTKHLRWNTVCQIFRCFCFDPLKPLERLEQQTGSSPKIWNWNKKRLRKIIGFWPGIKNRWHFSNRIICMSFLIDRLFVFHLFIKLDPLVISLLALANHHLNNQQILQLNGPKNQHFANL